MICWATRTTLLLLNRAPHGPTFPGGRSLSCWQVVASETLLMPGLLGLGAGK